MPKRIQRKRTKGWKMPEGAVYVGRPSKWGNPHDLVDTPEQRQWCIDQFRRLIQQQQNAELLAQAKKELRGKDLACWCKIGQPCHADVLLEIANRRSDV